MGETQTISTQINYVLCRCCFDHLDNRPLHQPPVQCHVCNEWCCCAGCQADTEHAKTGGDSDAG